MVGVVSPGKIRGSIQAPASKSCMQRACALALLNNGRTVIVNPGKSNDDQAALGIIKSLGAQINFEKNEWIIYSTGVVNANGPVSCGESGLAIRMFAPIAAISEQEIVFTGEGSLLKRPLFFFDEVFPLLGVRINTHHGSLPLIIKGPLKTMNFTMDGSFSSQYLTGLLFAFAKAAKKEVIISVKGLTSKPYIDLSLQMLKKFGYHVINRDYHSFIIQPVTSQSRDIVYQTEGDWSSASFILVAGAINGHVKVKGLDLNSVQADRAILEVLKNIGAGIRLEGNDIVVDEAGQKCPFEFNAVDCPDLFPPLVALASCCNGISMIKGVKRLIGKESNRAEALKDVFGKMGIKIRVEDDDMYITGGTGIHSCQVNSHHDHRIAMASAVAALKADGKVVIGQAEAVNKSYPDFYQHLQLLGVELSLS